MSEGREERRLERSDSSIIHISLQEKNLHLVAS